MKKKMLGLLVMAVCACMLAAGCGKDEKQEKTDKKAKVATEEKADKKVEKKYETIGNKTDDAYEILLTNKSGQDITAISVKSADKKDWPDNMILSGKKFVKDATVKFYYTPSKADSDANAKTDKAVNPAYDVKLTLADGTECQMTDFPFADMEEGTIKYEDKVAFVEYTSKETKDKVSTKEQELGLKAQREKAAADKAKADADAKAAQEAAAQEKAAQDAAAAAAPEQTNENQYQEPDYSQSYEEPYTEAPADQGSEGCLDGAAQNSEGCLDGAAQNSEGCLDGAAVQ